MQPCLIYLHAISLTPPRLQVRTWASVPAAIPTGADHSGTGLSTERGVKEMTCAGRLDRGMHRLFGCVLAPVHRKRSRRRGRPAAGGAVRAACGTPRRCARSAKVGGEQPDSQTASTLCCCPYCCTCCLTVSVERVHNLKRGSYLHRHHPETPGPRPGCSFAETATRLQEGRIQRDNMLVD